jgi:hypothetical protein
MRPLSLLLLALVLAGCSEVPFTSEDDDAVPLVCGPTHKQLPCTGGVEEGVEYRFNLLTHCGVEWAYFGGRYWVPRPKADPPSHWGNIEAGTMALQRPRVAVFEAESGGGARFVPASKTYRPPTCA